MDAVPEEFEWSRHEASIGRPPQRVEEVQPKVKSEPKKQDFSSSRILRLIRHFEKRRSGSSGLELNCLQAMRQATVCDGSKFDASAFCDYRLRSVEVDVRRCDVVDALMIVALDEGSDLSFEISGQIIVF
jgi:hypothetical protein